MFWDLCISEEREQLSPSAMEPENCCDNYTLNSSFTTMEDFNSPTKYEEEEEASVYEPTQTWRRPLTDLDHNSKDSGFSARESPSKDSSPKRLSFGSFSSMDEAFLDLSDIEQVAESPKLPGEFNKLIVGSLAEEGIRESPKVVQRSLFRRAFSMVGDQSTTSSRIRNRLFEDNESRSFKRPEPPTENSSPSVKRSRMNPRSVKYVPAKSLYRSVSACEETIKTALARSSTEPDLVGDFSKPFCLPLVPGKHQDLKSISPDTLSALIHGEYSERVASFQIIDCRYPYEFEGGHIEGAKNLYTKQQIVEHLINANCNVKPEESENHKRNVLVFHCEFSSERGPNLSRFLRSIDRSHNKDHYPFLHYPEIYLLDGGYKNFYETHPELCTPGGYLPMLHPDHEQDLRLFRGKSKTFNADVKLKSSRTTSFHRL